MRLTHEGKHVAGVSERLESTHTTNQWRSRQGVRGFVTSAKLILKSVRLASSKSFKDGEFMVMVEELYQTIGNL